MPKRASFERSRRELSLDVLVGAHTLLVVEQSSLESQTRGCARTPILPVVSVLIDGGCCAGLIGQVDTSANSKGFVK